MSQHVAGDTDTQGLWLEYRRTKDKAIRDRLIVMYAPLVKYVAGRLGSGLPAHVDEGDLVSYGLLGLIGAIDRYDPARDIKFETYAISRIKGAIIDELRALDWVPRSVRSRAREIERAIGELESKLGRAPLDEEIAGKVGISTDELEESLTDISRSSIAALDELWSVSGEGDQVSLLDTLEDPTGDRPADALDETETREAPRRRDLAAARAREARRDALLLRGADAARDRRGARRHRVARLAAPHEGDPAFEVAPLGGVRAFLKELRTQRLLLRQWRESDLEPFAALNADLEVMRYFPAPLTREQSDALADYERASIAERGWGFWAVEVAGVAPLVGFVGLDEVSFHTRFSPAVEVGWRLAREHWGRGYATEAARASVEFAFEELGLDEIVSLTTVANTRSRRVMERIGMTHDPADDFEHPLVPAGHPLRPHVLYRLRRR